MSFFTWKSVFAAADAHTVRHSCRQAQSPKIPRPGSPKSSADFSRRRRSDLQLPFLRARGTNRGVRVAKSRVLPPRRREKFAKVSTGALAKLQALRWRDARVTPIPAHRIFRILVHFGALYFVSEVGIVLSRHCPYVNFFSVVITKPWNPFHSSKYILVLIFLIVFCMEVLPEKITFASTQDEPHIGYFWRGGGVGKEVVPSCPQISREIVCADLPISSIFRRPGRGYPHD